MSNLEPGVLPSGWYADPHGRAVQRYWNGSAWTPYVIDASGQQLVESSAPTPSTMPSVHAQERSIVIQNVVQAPQPLGLHLGGVGPGKSMGTAVVLTVLFGPLGLFYSSVVGGAVLLAVTVLTFGVGIVLTWPAAIIWSIVAVNQHNARVINGMIGPQPIHNNPVGYPASGSPPTSMPPMAPPPPPISGGPQNVS